MSLFLFEIEDDVEWFSYLWDFRFFFVFVLCFVVLCLFNVFYLFK